MAVLMQQVQRRVHGVAPLGLEGDEDGSPREFQQPAQALPAGARPSAGCGWPSPQTLRYTHRKLWLHQARPRKASDSTTMRRRQRLRFTRRSAEGSARTRRCGRGRRREGRGHGRAGRGGAGPGSKGGRLSTCARQEVAVVQEELVAPTTFQLRLQDEVHELPIFGAVAVGDVGVVELPVCKGTAAGQRGHPPGVL